MTQATIKRDGLQIMIGTQVFPAGTCANSHELAETRQARISVSISDAPPNEDRHLLNDYRDVTIDFAVSDEERQGVIDKAVNEMLSAAQDQIDCMREARQFEHSAAEWLNAAVEKSTNRHSE